MSGAIQKLEGLLARVQRNRNAPRPTRAAEAARPSSGMPLEMAVEGELEHPLELSQPKAVVTPEARPAPAAARAEPTPAARAEPTPAPAARAEPTPAPAVRAEPAPAPAARPEPTPAPAARAEPAPPAPARAEPVVAPAPAVASAPIARATSPAPRRAPATFGELLERTLGLRPR
jgi:hypothetical protein